MTYQTDHEAMLSYEYWKAAYDADPDVLGKTIRMDGDPQVIRRRAAAAFRFLSFEPPVYMPLSSEQAERDVGPAPLLGKILIGRMAAGPRWPMSRRRSTRSTRR